MRVETHADHLFVWHRRAAKDVAELELVLTAIDEALEGRDLRAVVFDSRESAYQGGEVQQRMWAWIESHPRLRKIATLVESERLATSVNMTGLSKGVKIKAFHQLSDARTWLAS